jgi:hypothetical protein
MYRLMAFMAWSAVLLTAAVAAEQPAASPAQEHVRGDVVALKGDTLEVKSRSGEALKLKLADNARVALAEKADMGSIASGAFIGTTAVPQSDGTLRAVEVHVFPEAMRGTGEGHRPWDLQPGSSMTNATVAKIDESGGKADLGGTGSTMTNAKVAKVDESGGARKLSLKYKDGEKTVVVPPGTPVVKLEPGDRSKLVPGAHVFAIASRQPDGTLVAQRLTVGKDGLVPPM